MVASVLHGNGTLDEISADAYGRARPEAIAVTAKLDFDDPPSIVWSTGTFAYDGAGNLKAIGTDRFRYDGVSRLLEADLAASGTRLQAYTYDGFGNLTSITTDGVTRATDTAKATNRLTTATYDAAGNLTAWNGNLYTFDVLNRMQRLQSGAEDWLYVYDADDERILATNADRSRQSWTVRGLGQQVVARIEKFPPGAPVTPTPPPPCPGPDGIFCDDFESGGLGAWSAASSSQTLRHTDYFHRGSQLLAVATDDGETRHFSLDHLGTPRVVTSDFGELAARHDYFPYGEEITSDEQDGEVMKFTGHERDRLGTTQGAGATADDLDYMHARFNSPLTGRFLSIDRHSGVTKAPQTWNRYTYALNNPLVRIDLNGMWSTTIHNQIIDRAFPRLSAIQRNVLKKSSSRMDNAFKGGQNVSRSYQHAMRAPDQTVDDARRQAGQFLDKRISEAAAIQAGSGENGVSSRALSLVGDAIHLATDSVSPSHVGFQAWAGLGRPFEAYLHTMGEDVIISVDMDAAVAAARAIFESAFGAELLAQAIGQANAEQEAQDKANKTLGVFANSGCWFFGSCGVSH